MKNKLKKIILNFIKEDLPIIIIVSIVTLLFSKYIIGLAAVSGISMNDTYQNGDILLAKKFDKNPNRFDIIIFNKDKDVLIKRVIGLPGEKIRITENGEIYINNELLSENYGKEIINDPGLAINEITLSEDEYFVLGDNRNNSIDSRFPSVGIINKKKIVGIILFTK